MLGLDRHGEDSCIGGQYMLGIDMLGLDRQTGIT